MTNNTVIRLITFTVIVFCFIVMFLTATFSVPSDFRSASSVPGTVAISASTTEYSSQYTALSVIEETAEAPSM